MDVTFQGDLGRPGRGGLSRLPGTAPLQGAPLLIPPTTRPRPTPLPQQDTPLEAPPINMPRPPPLPAHFPARPAAAHLGMVMALCRKFSNFFWNEASCASSGGKTCPGGGCWQGQQPGSISASSSASSWSKRGSLLLVGSRRPGA